ncbi:DUF1740-domain-containing protein [Lojkania enalia]|uniref:DUF1740-domain-containing protein n=1 Tax=Lojkania enalia TaxID=147567 RepID=A0A9P4N0R7_9PLEO|nr:DUF1740-domain-containing protein [Didymosphaeria enalia]
MASNIPKFTSFRPKPKAPEPAKPVEKSEKGKKPPSERKRSPSKDNNPPPPHTNRPLFHEKEQSDFFVVDRRGDPSILKYGTIDRYTVPHYRRFGRGSVLGASSAMKIDRGETTDKRITLSTYASERRSRPLASRQVARESTHSIRPIKALEYQQPDLNMDYIPVSLKAKRDYKSDNENPPRAIEADYRALDTMHDQDAVFDSDAEYESGVEADYARSEVTQKNAALTQATRDQPNNLQSWLDLIAHQHAMLMLNRKDYDELSSADQRHLAEVKVSIYEQALREIGNDQNSRITLHLGLLAEASTSWDRVKLATKWIDVITQYSQSPEVWAKYLDFEQTNFANFKYEHCRVTFQKCVEAFHSSPDQIFPDAYLHILIRLTAMIQDAGYQEFSIAIWQAVLEYTLLAPIRKRDDEADGLHMRLFEEFWENEVPRIGELGAKGWRNSDLSNPVQAIQNAISLGTLDTPTDDFEAFQAREREHISKLRYPGRTADEIGDDDPFHLILFSDIEDCLKAFPSGASAEEIIEAFLCFCRLPPLPQLDPQERKWWSDPILRREWASSYAPHDEQNIMLRAVREYMSCPFSSFYMTTELLFEHGFHNISTSVDTTFIRHTLRLLTFEAMANDVIGEYLLGFELFHFPAEAYKTAKLLLKGRPTSLYLYNAYGLAECRRGNHSKADHVFSTALSMNSSFSFTSPGSLQLFSSWVWQALRQGFQDEALWRLTSPQGKIEKPADGSSEEPSKSALLRSRMALTEGRERALLESNLSSAVWFTDLLALLVYLSGGCDALSAISVHAHLIDWFLQRHLPQASAPELHAQFIARFLTYHASTAAIVKPSLLRSNLEPLIARFPNNSILLSTYAANERKFAIDDRVRSIMHKNMFGSGKSMGIDGWLFAIHYEMKRGEIAGSTSHSVRALFEKAEHDIGAHCPALWTRHVLFELEQAQKEKGKRSLKEPRKDGKKQKVETRLEQSYRRIKETFFRGLTHLPWCKDYMMLAFTHLKEGILSQEELRKVYNVMVEKEHRIFVDLDIETA